MGVELVDQSGTLDEGGPPAFANAITLGDFLLRLADVLGFFGWADDKGEQGRGRELSDANGLNFDHVEGSAAAFVQPSNGGDVLRARVGNDPDRGLGAHASEVGDELAEVVVVTFF